MVDGLVEVGVGVGVGAEAQPDRLEVGDHLVRRLEMAAAVEVHVLGEVREPLLVVGLGRRADLDGEPE